MAQLGMWLLSLSGCALTVAYAKKLAPGMIAITQLGAVLLAYVFAIFGGLRLGVYTVLALGLAGWAAAIVRAAIRRDGAFFKRFIAPETAVFTALAAVFAVGSRGMQVHTWDEFSHWAYAVQEMCLTGKLYTAAASNDLFKHYPPLMPLWQYIGQTLAKLFGGKGVSGPLLYFTHQLLGAGLLSAFAPHLHGKPWQALLGFAAALALPVIAYSDFYSLLYIDGYLGIIAGCTFALIAVNAWKKPFGALLLALCLAALTLTKESGLLFAVLAVLYLLWSVLSEEKGRRHWATLGTVAGAVVLAKASWSVHLAAMQIAGDSSQLGSHVYFGQVSQNFARFLFTDCMRVTVLRLPLSYFLVILLLIAAIVLLKRGKAALRLGVACAGTAIAYVIGLLLLYLYHFEAYNALRLASAARYLKTLIVCLLVIVYALAIRRMAKGKAAGAVALAVLIFMGSWGNVIAYVSGQEAEKCAQTAGVYQAAGELIGEKTGGSADARAKVYLLTQAEDDRFYYGIRYYVRPYAEVNADGWHVAEKAHSTAAYNAWPMDCDELSKRLDDYDYLYVDAVDDYLLNGFQVLFGGKPEAGSVYEIERRDDAIRLIQK